MSKENKAIFRQFIECINSGDLDVMGEIFSADFVNHHPRPGAPANRAGYKQTLSSARSAFSDFNIAIEDLIAEGDRVVGLLTVRGTHDGGSLGLPPSGRRVEFTAIAIHRIEKGEIRERWEVADTTTMMSQIGMSPPRDRS